jgi:hypothetical protein
MTILPILRPLQIFYGYLVYFVDIWYISPRFGIFYQEKSGNPGGEPEAKVAGSGGSKEDSKSPCQCMYVCT